MYLAAKVKILFNKTKVLSSFVYCVQGIMSKQRYKMNEGRYM